MSAADDPPPPYQAQDPGPPAVAPSAPPFPSIVYHVYRTSSGNYKVLLNNKTPSFYIKSHTLRTPDLVVHLGNGDYDREVATCNFPELGTNYEINLFREPNKKTNAVLSKMTMSGRFTTIASIPNGTGTAINAQRPFVWKQTPTLKELVDEETSQNAAFMREMAFGLTKCFVLEIVVPYGYGFELMVVTTAVTIYESQRREYSKGSGSSHASKRRMHGAFSNQMMGFSGGAAGGVAGGGF